MLENGHLTYPLPFNCPRGLWMPPRAPLKRRQIVPNVVEDRWKVVHSHKHLIELYSTAMPELNWNRALSHLE